MNVSVREYQKQNVGNGMQIAFGGRGTADFGLSYT